VNAASSFLLTEALNIGYTFIVPIHKLLSSPFIAMTRLALLFVVLSWLVVSNAQDQRQQHVLAEEAATNKPHPQAAEIVREKYAHPARFQHESRRK
jgi:hypothetical protein